MSKQQQWHARFFRSQGKAAAGGQVQFAHRAATFHDHRTQRGTAQGIDASTQQGHAVRHDTHQTLPRRTAKFGPTMGLQDSTLARAPLHAQPQYRLFGIGHAHSYAYGKPCSTREIIAFGSIDLMNTPPRQTAAQRGIERGNAERASPPLQRLCALRQNGRDDSHMFLLCSNPEGDQVVVLTFPR